MASSTFLDSLHFKSVMRALWPHLKAKHALPPEGETHLVSPHGCILQDRAHLALQPSRTTDAVVLGKNVAIASSGLFGGQGGGDVACSIEVWKWAFQRACALCRSSQ